MVYNTNLAITSEHTIAVFREINRETWEWEPGFTFDTHTSGVKKNISLASHLRL